MKISDYQFGRILIDNQTFTGDVIVYGEKILSRWWRKQGHRVDMDDLARVPLETASHLIIGTGYSGLMAVDRSVEEYCLKNKIDLEAMTTPEAVKRFNSLSGKKNLIGAFHLTC
jgi:hypothetical protein